MEMRPAWGAMACIVAVAFAAAHAGAAPAVRVAAAVAMAPAVRAEPRPLGLPAVPGALGDSARVGSQGPDTPALEDPERIGWQEPQRVVDWLRLRPGMAVADIGTGTGFFEPYLARAVGARGVVYAAEFDTTRVELLRQRAALQATSNVVPLLATAAEPRLPVARVDRVLVVNSYPGIDSRVAYFTRLRRWLDATSLLAIVDWLPGQLPRGPAPQHKISADEVIDELRRAGYVVVERGVLAYQYMLLFRPLESPAPR